MLRITLERRPSHDDLTAFGFAVAVVAAAVVCVAGFWTGGGPAWLASGVVTLLVTAGIGLLNPLVFAWPYRKWNGLARRFASIGQRATMGVMFYVVFSLVAGSGALFTRTIPAGRSGWGPKSTPDLKNQEGYVPGAGGATEWSQRLRTWSRATPSRWSLFLLPFLRLLDALEGQTSVRTVKDIYTLY